MFQRITGFFRDIRIKIAFIKYEKTCRIEHNSQAEKKFSIHGFQREICTIKNHIEDEANKIFKNDIDALTIKIRGTSEGIERNGSLLSFLTRNYIKELDEAHKKKAAFFNERGGCITEIKKLKGEMADAIKGKDRAYAEVNRCQGEVNWWYEKSERGSWRFGNKGKKIPQYSIFGQSQNDLSYWKKKREDAYSVVGEWRKDIGELKGKLQSVQTRIDMLSEEISRLKELIIQTKKDREHSCELRKEGHSAENIRKELGSLKDDLGRFQKELAKNETLRKRFFAKKLDEHGVPVLEHKIEETLSQKANFLQSFDFEENKARRISDHRVAWFKEH